METCVGVSSGTATQADFGGGDDPVSAVGRGKPHAPGTAAGSLSSGGDGGCRCQCIQPVPVFRDDLRICVDDLQGECDRTVWKPYDFFYQNLKTDAIGSRRATQWRNTKTCLFPPSPPTPAKIMLFFKFSQFNLL